MYRGRFSGPVLGALLIGVTAGTGAAQRAPGTGAVTLGEPRPAPVFPMTLVPFTIDADLCPRGRDVAVSLQVYNVLGQPVATLRIRDNRGQKLDRRPIRCGNWVAFWDGTVKEGARIAPIGMYYIRLTVGDRSSLPVRVRVRPP